MSKANQADRFFGKMLEIIHSATQKLLNIWNRTSGFFLLLCHRHILFLVLCPQFVDRNTYHHISLHTNDGVHFPEIIQIKMFQEMVIPF